MLFVALFCYIVFDVSVIKIGSELQSLKPK